MTQVLTRAARKKAGGRRRTGCQVVLIVLAVLFVFAAIAAAAAWQLLYRAENPVAPGKPVLFVVAKGDSTTKIASSLAGKGIVANSMMFRWRAKDTQLGSKLKPGTYSLSTGMPYDIVLEELAAGPDVVYYDVTIPEGFTAKRVAARMAARAHVDEAEMLELVEHGAPIFAPKYPYLKGAHKGSLEGFLFPKTYRIRKGTKPEAIVEMMLHQFDVEVAELDLSYASSRDMGIQEVVTIASIIERETRLPKEYRLVSSVVYNRLALPMRLQLDSTVFYSLPEGTKVLRKRDLAARNAWNTYTRDGLPLTPLCNPGMKALKAAAKPAKTKYLYYVLTSKDGTQTFATNYTDFLKAVRKYRALFGY